MRKLPYLFAFIFIFVSCKKYEEGPSFSLRTKTARVVNVWMIDKDIENGTQVALTADDLDDSWEFKKDGAFIYTDPGNSTSTGTWAFTSDKKQIVLTFSPPNPLTLSLTILRLTNDEFWFTTMNGSDKSEIHLKTK